MSNRKRVLIISCSIILLCIAIIAGMTYSLFTEAFTVKNHLRAGDLNITLTRTNLVYAVLDADGYLVETTVDGDLELSNTPVNPDGSPTTPNIFGINSTDIRIAPGSYFEAELEISNPGEVAFEFSVDMVLSGDATDLAKQLQVTITDCNGVASEPMFLSELSSQDGYLIANLIEMKANDNAPAETFKIRVDFIDDVNYNKDVDLDAGETLMDNNDAQADTAAFDLIVTATQKSKPGNTTNP